MREIAKRETLRTSVAVSCNQGCVVPLWCDMPALAGDAGQRQFGPAVESFCEGSISNSVCGVL